MTEAEWLACANPQQMLAFLRGRSSDRKMLLFACACCRRLHHLYEKAGREAIERLERYADGLLPEGQLLPSRWGGKDGAQAGAAWALSQARTNPAQTAEIAVRAAAMGAAYAAGTDEAWGTGRVRIAAAEEQAQGALLRGLFGPLLFRSVGIDPAWLTWESGTVTLIAEATYVERAYNRLPILADALEDAGCEDDALLAHLRGPGPHVRGCWALDLILGKR